MPNQIATWNPERDCWETGVEDIFGHSDVYSETWPTSGMTRNGVAYALPTWAPPITDSASSSSPPDAMFPTVTASEATGPGHPDSKSGGANLRTVVSVLPTPRAQNGEGRNQTIWERPPTQPQNLENALAVTLPTGDPTPPPSTAGNPSWEDVPLPLPSEPTGESTACPPASRNG